MSNVRYVLSEDLDEIVKIEQDSFSVPWSKDGFLEGLAREENIFLLYEDENGINGYAMSYVLFSDGEITNVAVKPEYRNKGIGKKLMEALILAAVEKNVTRLLLEVRVSNEPAIHLYESFGFKRIGVRKNFYSFPREDAIIMEKELD